ncbi:uncharacterized protein C3orf38 homolog isoform X2 [Panulirus ornatus]
MCCRCFAVMILKDSPFADNVRELLRTLDSEALLAMARTSSNNRILPLSSDEAIEIILIHTPDLGRLFSYRRMTAQVLFLYLHKKDVGIVGYASKHQLIMAVQEVWMKQRDKMRVPENSAIKRKASSEPEATCPSGRRGKLSGGRDGAASIHSNNLISSRVKNHTSFAIGITMNDVVQVEGRNGRVNHEVSIKMKTNLTAPFNEKLPQSTMTVMKSDEFTRDFCEWYYVMVNRLQPQGAHLLGDTFREEIFYSNSFTDVYLIGQTSVERHARGGENTFVLLRDTFIEFGLLFSPNLENGTQAHKSSQGIVTILCCGTLHHDNSFVGIFEQEFGLVYSPVDRAWKIMYIKINLKQCSVQCAPPSLPKCQVFKIEA